MMTKRLLFKRPGGKENIKDVTNCTTRLRLTVNDESKVQDSSYFTHNQMAHGLVKSGKSVQVVVGMSVPQVREAFEHLVYEEEKLNITISVSGERIISS